MRLINLNILLALMFFSSIAVAQTHLSGGIYQDVTLNKNGNPYIIHADLTILPGVTLILEPGTVFKFQKGAKLIVRGNLWAWGAVGDSILFTADTSAPYMGYYTGIRVEVNGAVDFGKSTSQIDMKYCIGEYAKEFIEFRSAYNGPYKIRYSRFAYNKYVNYGVAQSANAIYWEDCFFHNNYSCMSGGGENHKVYIRNCWFVNNAYGSNGGHVSNCVYKGNTGYGASLYQEIENSFFFENKVGVMLDMHHDTKFFNNEVFNNDVGIEIGRMWQQPGIVLTNNRICHNTTYNVQYDHWNNVDLAGNCWCSNDPAFISSKIRDGYDDPQYGLISFESHLNCGVTLPNPMAIEDVSASQASFVMYPNPARNTLTIEPGEGIRKYDVVIRDLKGSVILVKQQQFGKVSIDIADLSAGLYMVQVVHDGSPLPMQKLMVNTM